MRDLEASLAAVSRQHEQGCVKIWEDLARYRTIIDRVRPDLIVEAGCFSGKASLWLARTAACPVVTIDVTPCLDPETIEAWADLPITLITGSTIDPEVIARVGATAANAERVLVSLDSDHSAAHVAAEIAAYGPMVTPGSYLVVEDGLLRFMPDDERRHYTGDPLEAIEHVLATDDRWEVDTELEDMYPATQHPSGFLRRRY